MLYLFREKFGTTHKCTRGAWREVEEKGQGSGGGQRAGQSRCPYHTRVLSVPGGVAGCTNSAMEAYLIPTFCLGLQALPGSIILFDYHNLADAYMATESQAPTGPFGYFATGISRQ